MRITRRDAKPVTCSDDFVDDFEEEDIEELDLDAYLDTWWFKEYEPISETEVCWDMGCTIDELKESVAEAFEDFEGYIFDTFMAYTGSQPLSDKYQTVMLCETPKGDQFLAIQDRNGRLTDVTEDIFLELGYADHELGRD